jgi:hypothetical protein
MHIYIFISYASKRSDQELFVLYVFGSEPAGTEPNRTEPAPVRFLAGLEPVWQKPNRNRIEPNRSEA